MNTIEKGFLTELQCQKDFIELGYIVSQPIIPCRYDFLVDLGDKIIKVQCKSSHLNDTVGKSITFYCQSTHNPKGGKNIKKGYKNQIDYFYTCWEEQGYLVPVSECSSTKTLRFTVEHPTKTMNWAKDYEIQKVLEEVSK